jgi:NAD-dependent DNA ligase
MSDFKNTKIKKKDLTEKLLELGAKVEKTVKNSTDILIVGDITTEKKKAKNAQKQSNTEIIELEEFNKTYNLNL